MELRPLASIVEMDTVIRTVGSKGCKCLLTLLFRQFNFMLIYLLPYKRSVSVNKVFLDLKHLLGDNEFSRLFEVIITAYAEFMIIQTGGATIQAKISKKSWQMPVSLKVLAACLLF